MNRYHSDNDAFYFVELSFSTAPEDNRAFEHPDELIVPTTAANQQLLTHHFVLFHLEDVLPVVQHAAGLFLYALHRVRSDHAQYAFQDCRRID